MTKSQIAIEISKQEPYSAFALYWDKISKKELEEELKKILSKSKATLQPQEK